MFSPCQPRYLKLFVSDHETSHERPMLFSRAHAVLSFCASLVWCWLTLPGHIKENPIQETRPWQTALRGLAQMPNNKLTIMYLWQMQVVVLDVLLESDSRPVSVSKSCCEDLWNGLCWECLWCRSMEFSTRPQPIGLFDLFPCERLLGEPLACRERQPGLVVCVCVCWCVWIVLLRDWMMSPLPTAQSALLMFPGSVHCLA